MKRHPLIFIMESLDPAPFIETELYTKNCYHSIRLPLVTGSPVNKISASYARCIGVHIKQHQIQTRTNLGHKPQWKKSGSKFKIFGQSTEIIWQSKIKEPLDSLEM